MALPRINMKSRKPGRSHARDLGRDLDEAPNYDTWLEIATELDRLDGGDAWRGDDTSEDYDHQQIRSRLSDLRQLRKDGDVTKLVFWLHEGMHRNVANIINPVLYGRARAGTKDLIITYVREVSSALNFLCEDENPDFPFEKKMRFFKRVGKSMGRSALMLSGGATLGVFHLGVIKGLWSTGLLPRVISGSSAGSIMAGIIGVHLDEELPRFFDPEYLSVQAWRIGGIREVIDRRALMDPDHLELCLRDNIGEMSFEEAFARTGRIVNITVSPTTVHQQPRLLNYLTAPNVLILRASLASCAVPGLFPPVSLRAKTFEGKIVPYMPRLKWSDGSLKSDLPMLRLSRLHDVNHYIVSQTNPHILPFVQSPRTTKRGGLLPFMRRLVTSSAQVYGKHVLDISRQHIDSPGVGRLLDELYAVVNQQYRGDITVAPKLIPANYRRLLANPTTHQVRRLLLAGERSVWPRIEQIRIATAISQTLDACIQRLKLSQNQHPAGIPQVCKLDVARPPNAVGGRG